MHRPAVIIVRNSSALIELSSSGLQPTDGLGRFLSLICSKNNSFCWYCMAAGQILMNKVNMRAPPPLICLFQAYYLLASWHNPRNEKRGGTGHIATNALSRKPGCPATSGKMNSCFYLRLIQKIIIITENNV